MLKTRLLFLRKVFRAHVCLVNFTSSFISNVFIINDYQDELRMCVSLSRDSITFGILPPPPTFDFFFFFKIYLVKVIAHKSLLHLKNSGIIEKDLCCHFVPLRDATVCSITIWCVEGKESCQ